MPLSETLSFYLLVGAGVAAAIYVADDQRLAGQRRWMMVTSVAFWPLYLPLLLSRTKAVGEPQAPACQSSSDEMQAAILQVESELDCAFSSLDGWAENVLSRERSRLNELRSALCAHADRIRQMDALLARVNTQGAIAWQAVAPPDDPTDRCRQSELARTQNLGKLAEVRRQSHADLMATLAWIRELVSMIHLAKFTGAPASRAEELVAQIAAAVEGIAAVEAECSQQPRLTDHCLTTASAAWGENRHH
jgi:hypothetical protein